MAHNQNLPENFNTLPQDENIPSLDKQNIREQKIQTQEVNTDLQINQDGNFEFSQNENPANKESEGANRSKEQENESTIEKGISAIKNKLIGKKQKPTVIPQVRDELTLRIEKIMEEDLKDAYQELSPIQKQEFKIKGEETAWKIRQLMKSGHSKIKQIFKLIFEWLKLLPGINKFFLEQEAKIKADRIIALQKHK